MVLGLLTITAIPTVTGVSFGANEQRKQNSRADDEKRMAKFHMDVYCEGSSQEAKSLHGRRVVLRDNKAYLEHAQPSLRKQPAHTAQAFYIAYPDESRRRGDGLVSTVSDDPPMLNWIYADSKTLDVKYGNRSQSIENIVGPWDWTKDEQGVTLDGKELFAAVEEEQDVWALYYDRDADGLAGVVDPSRRVVGISIDRNLVEEPKKEKEEKPKESCDGNTK